MIMKVLIALCTLAALVFEPGNGTALNRVRRLVNGQVYPREKFRFSVSLWLLEPNSYTINTLNLRHFCGSSLLNENWVMTQAACFEEAYTNRSSDVTAWKVAIGMYNQTDPEDSFQIREITEIHLNHYRRDEYYGNLALVRLNQSVDLSDPNVATTGYNADPNCPAVNQRCKVIGWGQINESPFGYGSAVPHVASVNVVDTTLCNATYNTPASFALSGMYVNITSGHMCAELPQGGAGHCFGDAGSPLLCKCDAGPNNDEDNLFDDQGYVVVGIIDFGLGCNNATYPGVFVRVSAFADYMGTTIAENP